MIGLNVNAQLGRSPMTLFALSIAVAVTVYAFDLRMPLGVAGGVPYVGLVLLGLWAPWRRYVFVLALAATVLIALGYLLSPPGGTPWVVLTNRYLALIAVWVTAVLAYHHKGTEEALRLARNDLEEQVRERTAELRKSNEALRDEVAERRRAEESLRQSEQRLRLIADALPVVIVYFDADLRYRFLNETHRQWQGVDPEELIGKHIGDFVSAETFAVLRPHLEAALSGERVAFETELPYATAGNRNVHITLVPHFGVADEVTGIYGLAIDITERKAAEAALRESEAQLRGIMDNVADGVVTVDEGSHVESFTPAAQRMFGYSAAEVIGRDVAILMTEPDRSRHGAYVSDYLTTGKSKILGIGAREVTGRRKDGSTFPLEITVGEMSSDGKRRFVGALRDITERKGAEAALRAAKEEAERANRAKSRFLAAASHDLRQPLHALGLFASVLAGKVRGEGNRRLVQKIGASLEALDRMFGALLDISRLEAGVITPAVEDFRVRNLLERMTDQFTPQADEKGIEFRVVACGAVVRSDSALLDRILRNMISNAVRYTDSGRVLLGCRRRGAALRIEVWDTGPGIPEAQLSEVFQEFERLPRGGGDQGDGLGLGLTIVERMSRLLGHSTHVSSVPGKGSMFAVEVPCGGAKAKGRRRQSRTADDGVDVAGARILVLDDEACVLEGTVRVLEEWGCRVRGARSIEEALAGLAVFGGPPNLIIADYRLGQSMTGSRAVERIQAELGAEVPAIIITGDTAPARLREAQASGHELLHKPFPPDRLRRILVEVLHDKSWPTRRTAPKRCVTGAE